MKTVRPLTVAAVFATLALLLAACGDNDNDGDTATATTAEETAQLTPQLRKAVDDYRAYVQKQTALLAERTTEFADAVKQGDIERAKQLFAPARAPFEAIEPVAGLFGDLDPRIDARENDAAEENEDWTGFHRIEKALWVDEDVSDMGPMADQLVDDVNELKAKAHDVELTPVDMAGGATELLGEVSKGKITGEEDRYSHTDLWDFEANVDGSRKAFTLLRPALAAEDPALAQEIADRFDEVATALGDYRDGDGFVPYTQLTDTDTKRLSQTIDALAEPLSKVAGKVENS